MISKKELSKQIGIIIVMGCAVFVCNLFLNFQMDLISIKDNITDIEGYALYDSLLMSGKVICSVSGGSLCATSMVMMIFYIKHYIDEHKKDLGIMKAIGYSNVSIAKAFWIFGGSVFLGASIGYAISFLVMPSFYHAQNEAAILPEIMYQFHPELLFFLIFAPTLLFAFFAILYAFRKLHQPTMFLLKGKNASCVKIKRRKDRNKEVSFLNELRKATLKSRYALIFFIFFGSFCFSTMMQMASSIEELSSEIMKIIILVIGIVLSFTMLFLALSTVVRGNSQTIAMLQVFGYTRKECQHAILDGYRKWALIGFFLGTIYQYVLMKFVTLVVFKDLDIVPTIEFDWISCAIVFVLFILLYEGLLHLYSRYMNSISLKEVMLEN